jgi:hypothetical protein
MITRPHLTWLVVAVLALAPACSKKPSAPPPEPDAAPAPPPEPAADAAPPAPEPRDELAKLVASMAGEAAQLAKEPFKSWSQSSGALLGHDAQLAEFEKQVPDEAPRIAKIRALVGGLDGAIKKKQAKPAQKALKALQDELAK